MKLQTKWAIKFNYENLIEKSLDGNLVFRLGEKLDPIKLLCTMSRNYLSFCELPAFVHLKKNRFLGRIVIGTWTTVGGIKE